MKTSTSPAANLAENGPRENTPADGVPNGEKKAQWREKNV
jgi:hypothetical protein